MGDRASELVNKDIIGKSDPFVKVKLGDQELKSRKVRNTLEPEWNFSAELIVSKNDKGKTISVEVYDDDFGKENFIGSYTVQLREAIKNADSITGWHKLEGCKTGNIKLSAKYT